ncbi:hypothetical protein [Streptomonospora salina]|uniref:Uncharacterized membrane protein YjjP (DUF1212 family) n=1 Tax=Streptomonospora salina TaxID=104205 RepID=A0A841EAE7_9ACTN|nr:hypothetical protein [Streptomonospora salina]MBB5999972.1 uncharacterized membrane protein YjjP (DUF1212 family) [Streptomonospora salina]
MTGAWHDGRLIAMDKELPVLSAAMAFKALFGADLDTALISEIDRCVTGLFTEVAVRTITPAFPQPSSARTNCP